MRSMKLKFLILSLAMNIYKYFVNYVRYDWNSDNNKSIYICKNNIKSRVHYFYDHRIWSIEYGQVEN